MEHEEKLEKLQLEIQDAKRLGVTHQDDQSDMEEPIQKLPAPDKRALKQASDLLEYMRAPNPLFIGHEDVLKNIHRDYKEYQPSDEDIDPLRRRSVIHVINGLAGCGKSEIAIQYVKKYFKSYTSGVLWIPAGSPVTLDYVFKRTAEKLNLFGEKKDVRPDVIKKAVTDWLTEKSNWLLVLDNADLSHHVFDYFPTFPIGGHIIITSRDTSYVKSPLHPEVAAQFQITPLKEDDAMHLLVSCFDDKQFRKHKKVTTARDKVQEMKKSDPENYEALKWLAGPDGLDGLPLALIAAAKYMNENKTSFSEYKELSQSCIDEGLFPTSEDDPLQAWLRNCGLEKYLSKIRRKTQNSLTAFLELTRANLLSQEIEMSKRDADRFIEERKREININKWMYKRKSVLATWSLTFRYLKDTKQGKAALELLQMSVFLEPTVSEQLIIRGAEHITLNDLKLALLEKVTGLTQKDQEIQTNRNLKAVLKELRRHCLVDSNDGNIRQTESRRRSQHNFTIHRVMRKAVKADLSGGSSQVNEIAAISSAISLLSEMFPSYQEVYRRFTGPSGPIIDEEEEVAVHTKSLARNLRNDLLESAKTNIQNPAQLLYSVALYYRIFKWRPDEALPLLSKALQVDTIFTTKDDRETRESILGRAHFQIGRVYMELRRIDKALQHLEKAEEHFNQSCPSEDSSANLDFGKLYFIQAMTLEGGYSRDYGKPIPDDVTVNDIDEKFQKAIYVSEKYYNNTSGKSGQWTAVAKHEYAVFLQRKEPPDNDKIETLLRDSLRIKEDIWGSDDDGNHISIAIGMTDLARFYLVNEVTSKYEEVEELLTKALEIKECVLPHYEQFLSWQIGIYLLIRLYMLLPNEGKQRKYEEILKTKSDKSFEEEFKSENLYKALPLDPLIWA